MFLTYSFQFYVIVTSNGVGEERLLIILLTETRLLIYLCQEFRKFEGFRFYSVSILKKFNWMGQIKQAYTNSDGKLTL